MFAVARDGLDVGHAQVFSPAQPARGDAGSRAKPGRYAFVLGLRASPRGHRKRTPGEIHYLNCIYIDIYCKYAIWKFAPSDS